MARVDNYWSPKELEAHFMYEGKAEKCWREGVWCQATAGKLSTVVKAKDLGQDFLLDYIKMCMLSDIPLEKTNQIS